MARAAPPAPLASQESRPQVRNSDPALLAAAGTLGAGLGPGDRAQHLPMSTNDGSDDDGGVPHPAAAPPAAGEDAVPDPLAAQLKISLLRQSESPAALCTVSG